MTSERLDIVMDVSEEHQREFFDKALLARLHRLGIVRRHKPQGHDARRDSDERSGSDERDDRDGRLAADVVVTGWESAPLPQHLRTADRLRLVAHVGGTIRFLVPKSLIIDGLYVTQAGDAMVASVAEYCLLLTLSSLRRFPAISRAMERGDWRGGREVAPGITLAGTRVGVVGASRIGRAYIAALRALGAHVLVYDPYLSHDAACELGAERTSLHAVLSACSLVALHAPVTPETVGMIDAHALAAMRDGATLINTARSALVDSRALEEELRSGRLHAALDVFDEEPLPASSPLWKYPNVILTPHAGAFTTTAQREMGALIVADIERYARGESMRGLVTAERYDLLA